MTQDNDKPAMMSADISELMTALALAQSKISSIEHNRNVEMAGESQAGKAYKVKYSYATLAQVLHSIRHELTENGCWYTQRIDGGHMVTRIFHKSGQWMDTGHIPMPNVSGKPAAVGSVVSFFKRYSLSAAMGLASEEDNGGEDGDRDVNFRARGERQDRDEIRDVATGVEEPEEGWGDWARTLIAKVEKAADEEALNALRDDNKRLINGASKIDRMMYKAIGDAFAVRRSVVGDDVPF
jgi:hypothetical protein